jgi:hypothetical protein
MTCAAKAAADAKAEELKKAAAEKAAAEKAAAEQKVAEEGRCCRISHAFGPAEHCRGYYT